MTTPAAAQLYEAQHLREWEGKGWAVHNPHDKPLTDLPVIYGFNNGGNSDFLSGVLIAEDGTKLGSHGCSSEGYMPHDLGILDGARPDRHKRFQEHYPDGYRMEFVGYDGLRDHKKLMTVIRKANETTNEHPAA